MRLNRIKHTSLGRTSMNSRCATHKGLFVPNRVKYRSTMSHLSFELNEKFKLKKIIIKFLKSLHLAELFENRTFLNLLKEILFVAQQKTFKK